MGPEPVNSVYMVIITAILACLGLFADARSTRIGLKEGFPESRRIRRFLIRVFGLNGGTYGVAAVASAIDIAVSLLSKQPDWALALGNCLIAAICAWAAFRNAEAI